MLERLPNLRIDGPVVRTGLVGNGHHHGSLVATAVLLLESRTVSDLAKLAEGEGDPRGLGSTLVHSVGGLVVLLLVTAMPVAKPRGITRYGWRKQQEHRRGGVPAGVR